MDLVKNKSIKYEYNRYKYPQRAKGCEILIEVKQKTKEKRKKKRK